MTEKLFRKEVINHQRENIYGHILLTTPLRFKVMTMMMVVVALLIALFLFYGQYSRKENVKGYLVPDQGIVRVFSKSRGTIKESHVVDGQQVHAGDVLFQVGTESYTFDNLVLNDAITSKLHQRLKNTQEKIANEKTFFINEKSRYEHKIATLEKEIKTIKEQQETAKNLMILSEEQWREHEEYYAKRLVLEAVVEVKKIAYLQAKSSFNDIQRFILNKENELQEAQQKLLMLPQEEENRMLDLQDTLSQINQGITEAQSSQAHIIRAPISGVVTTILFNQGQSVADNSLLLTILPNEYTLHAELFLPSRSIGFVKKGKKVLLRYDAFPYQRYGLYEGAVSEVGATTLSSENYAIPFNNNEPVYKIKVNIFDQNVSAYGKNIALQPGMLVSAGIILENRSMLEWLLEPILSLRGTM